MNEKLREQFEKETNKTREVTERFLAHSVTIINRAYVFWLEDRISKLEQTPAFSNVSGIVNPCPNCKETIEECACMRNKCNKCGKPIGNITFSVCDACWNKD